MVGRYIGPQNGPSFLIKKDLFDIPGWKAKHMESFFKAHLFNGAINYISTLPELREQFCKWLRLSDLPPENQTSDAVFERLKFLALKLKGPRKDEFIFEKENDPFIRIFYMAAVTEDLSMYYLLLNLFPEDMTQTNEALMEINFSASTFGNIWKHFKPELLKIKFDPPCEIEIDGDTELENEVDFYVY